MSADGQGNSFAFREQVFVYLDDLLIFSETFEEHLKLLKLVSDRLQFGNLTINVKKSKFCLKEFKYLGYIVGNREIKTDPAKVEAIKNIKISKTIKQLRSFLGMTNWYRRFIKDFSTLAAPITDCLKV